MSDTATVHEAPHPIPRDRQDQQASTADPLDIETMVRHARQNADAVSGR
ncbi:hypothetical protein AB0454_41995 [Streptomyces sp. NPDC093509]